MARCIALDIDCAEICRLAAAYMSRGSDLAGAVCDMCADECRRMASGHRRAAGAAEHDASRAAH
jgi:hypothetical protein